jgi:hypothetical protein
VDEGFACIAASTVITIKKDDGGLFFLCADGNHYLESQKDENGACVGLSRTPLL